MGTGIFTCHQGRNDDGIWSGGQMQGKASMDHREGLPSRCAQGPDLSSGSVRLYICERSRDLVSVGIPWNRFGRSSCDAGSVHVPSGPCQSKHLLRSTSHHSTAAMMLSLLMLCQHMSPN